MEGESGRNELLRGPFALFGVRISAKLVRDLAKHRRTPMSPPQLIPPTSPGQVFAGDGRLRRRFSHTGPGPLRTRIVSRVKCGGGPCRGHSVLPCTGNTICLHCAFIKGARFGICLRKHVVAATGPSPFKVGDNQRPERTMSGAGKIFA